MVVVNGETKLYTKIPFLDINNFPRADKQTILTIPTLYIFQIQAADTQ